MAGTKHGEEGGRVAEKEKDYQSAQRTGLPVALTGGAAAAWSPERLEVGCVLTELFCCALLSWRGS